METSENYSEESQLGNKDTKHHILVNSSLGVALPQISLTIPSQSSPSCRTDVSGKYPKSCLKYKNKMVTQEQGREKHVDSGTIMIPVDKIYQKKNSNLLPKSKSRRLKTNQERIYMFLEHPAGWTGFVYHISV